MGGCFMVLDIFYRRHTSAQMKIKIQSVNGSITQPGNRLVQLFCPQLNHTINYTAYVYLELW